MQTTLVKLSPLKISLIIAIFIFCGQKSTAQVDQRNVKDTPKINIDSVIKVNIHKTTSDLDEVQVIAYGKSSRRFNTGSIATISAQDIEIQPVSNILQTLQGRVAGLALSPTSGQPGATVNLTVRGQNSISSGQNMNPLYIIDGVPIAGQNDNINNLMSSSGNGQGSYTGTSFSAISNINPNDVESITILKDADATSIYGSMGSNGVILINTKKGSIGNDIFNISGSSGLNSSARPVKYMNTQQYLQIRKEALSMDGSQPGSSDYDLTVFDTSKYTNFPKKILGKTTNFTTLNLGVSGGNQQNTYRLSGGYNKSDFNFPGNYSNQVLSLHSSYHHQSLNKKFSLDFGTDYSYNKNNIPSFNSTSAVLNPPNLPDLLDAKGNLVWEYKGVDLTQFQYNGYLKQANSIKTNNILNTLNLKYIIINKINIMVNAGYSRVDVSRFLSSPAASQSPSYGSYASSSFVNNTLQNINIEPQINYETKLSKGDLSALLGGTYRKDLGNNNYQYGRDYTSDKLMGSINGAGTVVVSDGSSIHKYVGVFGRLKYIYDRKYIFNFSGRRDGSSYFGANNRFGNFGAVGLGWIFSEEKLFKNKIGYVSYAKLSGSYGTSGTDGEDQYLYQSLYLTPPSNPPIPQFQGIVPIFAQNFYNPDFSWATKKSLNLSLDLGIFKDKILLNTTFYRNVLTNQLINRNIATQAGFSRVYENTNALVQNKGWEFLINTKNIVNKNFIWTSSFNMTLPNNKLIAYDNLENTSDANYYIIGKSLSIVKTLNYKGVNPTTGLYEFYTSDGKTTNKPNLDYQKGDFNTIVDLQPKFFGGFGNNLGYKGLNLSFFLQFFKQKSPNYLSTLIYNSGASGGPGSGIQNMPIDIYNDYWKQEGDKSTLQRLSAGSNTSKARETINAAYYFAASDGVYRDNTYLRLKTISLSYSFKKNWVKKIGFRDLSFYINAQNLLTITNYKSGDPELPGGYASFPIQKTIVFGFNLHL